MLDVLKSHLRLFINYWAKYIKHKEMGQTRSIHAKDLGKICKYLLIYASVNDLTTLPERQDIIETWLRWNYEF